MTFKYWDKYCRKNLIDENLSNLNDNHYLIIDLCMYFVKMLD